MATQTATQLKAVFETGDQPSSADFINVFDSHLNLTDGGTVAGDITLSGIVTASSGVAFSGTTDFSGSATPTATGGGFDGAELCKVTVGNINGEIVTKILVDLTGLVSSGTEKDVIGENDTAAAYMTRITTGVNGYIYRADMACIESPTGTNAEADIDLVTSSDSIAEDAAYDGGSTEVALIPAGADWGVGMWRQSAGGLDCANINASSHYVYLADGSGGASGGTYTAGKFLIRLYGYPTF